MNFNPKDILVHAQLRVTKQRMAILEQFKDDCKPFDVEVLRKKLKKIDRVTIYRTLSCFERKGLIKRADIRNNSISYERAGNHHHHHIVCTDCGVLEPFEQCHVPTDNIVKNSKKFRSIHDHALELYGQCVSCKARS